MGRLVPGKETPIERYWRALGNADGATMADCYADDAIFDDPVVSINGGKTIGAMWKTVLGPGTNVRITTGPLNLRSKHATGAWEAVYNIDGRKVTNRVQSTFSVRDGVIAGQQDSFTFWKWSRQAHGWPGLVFGWTPVMRRVVSWQLMKKVRASIAPAPKPKAEPTEPVVKPWTRLALRFKSIGAKKGKKAAAAPPTSKTARKPKTSRK